MSGLRELRVEDAEQVASLFVEAFGEARQVDAEEIRTWIDNEELKPEHLRVLVVDGAIVGYGDIWVEDDEVALDVAAPGHWEPFLEWAEAEARARGVTARTFVPAEHELARIVAARGYRLARSSYTMDVELDGPPEPVLPEDCPCARTAPTTPRCFAPPSTRPSLTTGTGTRCPRRTSTSSTSSSGTTTPCSGCSPGTGTSSRALCSPAPAGARSPSSDGSARLGVRPAWRRRGLGEALLRSAFAELFTRGHRRVGLGVDTENVSGALRLYERVGMRPLLRSDNWTFGP